MNSTGLFDSLETPSPSAEDFSLPLHIAAVALEQGIDRVLEYSAGRPL
jgi:hypothetical protein